MPMMKMRRSTKREGSEGCGPDFRTSSGKAESKFRALWEEFEAQETVESKFARTMDNIQPIMLNAATDGKAREEHDVHIEQILNRNRNTAKGSEAIWEYAKEEFFKTESGKMAR